jgi:Tol biopolymer transport system component
MAVVPPGVPFRLTAASDDPRELAISPGGQQLVYAHQSLDWNIWRLALNNKEKGKANSWIASTRLEFHPRYSPDGQRIAFESLRQ